MSTLVAVLLLPKAPVRMQRTLTRPKNDQTDQKEIYPTWNY